MMRGSEDRIAVVGGSIIGVAIAFELQRRGRDVMVIDRGELGRGTSFGSMASIAVTEFLPSSRPAVLAQIPKWLLDPEGPVRLRPTYLPRLMPWLLRFLAASLPSRVRALEAAGAALCQRVHEDLLPMLEAAGLSDLLTHEGCLSLYTDDAEYAADRDHIAVLERFGFEHVALDGNALRKLEPAISGKIGRAVLFPHNRSVRDTCKLVVGLAERFRSLGGQLVRGDVVGFERRDQRVQALRLGDGRLIPVAETVLCAGAYTGRLSKLLGEPIPLETERGYSTQIMAPGIDLRHSIIWPARAFMVTPTSGGIRVGGTVEMAGLDAAPDFRRARVLVKRAQQALPNLQAREATEWMGHRPALPDTIPIIGPSAKHRRLYYATGHGHLGVTYAATTARLIGDLIMGIRPPIDLAPFRVDRF
jgi:D-amino-acid dehydrogenase